MTGIAELLADRKAARAAHEIKPCKSTLEAMRAAEKAVIEWQAAKKAADVQASVEAWTKKQGLKPGTIDAERAGKAEHQRRGQQGRVDKLLLSIGRATARRDKYTATAEKASVAKASKVAEKPTKTAKVNALGKKGVRIVGLTA
jgi:hypothetical protein